jgi:hypothetical protein
LAKEKSMTHRRRLSSVLTFAVLLSLVGTNAAWAMPGAQPPAPPGLYLKSGNFAPGAGQQPAIPPGLAIAGYNAQQRGYYIVQFAGPILQEWRDALTATGADVVAYLPDFAYKVRMNPGQLNKVTDLPGVLWIGLFQPAFKLSPDLKLSGDNVYRVRVEQGGDAGLTQAAIATSGAEVLQRDNDVLLVAANGAQVAAIAQVADVAWIENIVLNEKHNETGAGVIIGAATANANGYNGSSQIAAVADTGLGGGTAATAHADIPGSRVVQVFDRATVSANRCYVAYPNGAKDEESGHGTHVAVSVVGDGDATGLGKAAAPAARLVFQAVEDYVDMYASCNSYADGYYLLGIPNDLKVLFQQAYDAGARIHANSWGSAVAGDYTLDSANADTFVWQKRDMLITFSAGNEGIDANANGVIDNDSIGSPATAKNVLTVGASENQRPSFPCDATLPYQSHDAYQPSTTCAGMNGQNLLGTYGQRWGADYPANPIANDLSAGNAGQMAAFSSRGPTDDGRIKPDVVAPGTWILSGYSNQHQEGYGGAIDPLTGGYQMDGWGMPYNGQYKYFGGTSMSNPIAAGGATVVRDFYQKAHSLNASAALVKATLINSAVDLLDENNDGADDNDFPIPNVHEGWGLINLASATDNSAGFVEQTTGLATNGVSTYAYITPGAAPFKLTLVWSDFASTETAAKNLVNDLDLEVTSPSGVVYRGNVFAGGWTQPGGSADRVNNVENVYVNGAEAGTWTVRVRGFNVPSGPQPFALVVDGGAATTPPPPPAVNVHVGDLDGSKSGKSTRWTASVSVLVHSSSEAPVTGVAVSGAWSGATSGSATCTTTADGRCTVSKSNIRTTGTAIFTISNLGGTGITYVPGANHDPDGDSTGTAIGVTNP